MCVLGNTPTFIHVCAKAGKPSESKAVGSGVALSGRNKSKLTMKNIQWQERKVGRGNTRPM